MKQIALFSIDWEVWGHAVGLCPAPRSVRNRLACNGHLHYDLNLDYYVCVICGQMSTDAEIKGLSTWTGEL